MIETTEKLIEISEDLDSLKEEGIGVFADGPTFDDALAAAAPRAYAYEDTRTRAGLGIPETIGAAWAEGVLIGYRLARADRH